MNLLRFLYIFLFSILILIFFTNNRVHAQVRFGIFGGIDQSRLSGDLPGDLIYDFKIGYIAGIYFDFRIAEDVFLGIRPSFTLGGANISVSDTTNADNEFLFPIVNKYLSVPAIFQIYVSRGFYVNSGIDFNYCISSEAKIFNNKVDLTGKINRMVYQAVFGFGFAIPIGRTAINLEFSYAQGINTFTKKVDYESGTSPRIRNSRLRLTTFFVISTGKRK